MSSHRHKHKQNLGQTAYTLPPAAAPNRRPLLIVGALALLAIIGGLLAFAFAPRAPQGTPEMELDKTLVDFGDVSFETPVEAVFTIRNTGDGPLQIGDNPHVALREGC
jgi:hypothetical protein